MKRVKLEDVTGEQAVREAPARPQAAGEPEVIGRPKTIEEQMESAAGQAAWGIVACFGVAVLWFIFGGLSLVGGATVDAAILVVAGVIEAACGWFYMVKRSRFAALTAIGLFAFLAISVWVGGVRPPSILELIVLGAMANGVTGVFSYHRLAEQVKAMKMSNEHIKDVFGGGEVPAEETA